MTPPKWASVNHISIAELESEWNSSPSKMHSTLLANRSYHFPFLISHWGELTELEKEIAIAKQQFPFQFLESIWCYSSRNIRYYIIKNHVIPVEFIIEHWHELDNNMCVVVVTKQTFIQKLSLKELPIFLADINKSVRDIALNVYRAKENE